MAPPTPSSIQRSRWRARSSIPLASARGRCKPENTRCLRLPSQASLTEKAGAVQFHASQWDAGASEWVKLTPPVCNSHKALSQHPVWVRSCPASPPWSWLQVNPKGDVLSGRENTCESWVWGDRGSGNTAEDATVSPFLSWPLEIQPGEGADKACVVSVAP